MQRFLQARHAQLHRHLFWLVVPRQADDRHTREGRIGELLTTEFEPIHHRHHHVEQDDAGHLLPNLIQRLNALVAVIVS